MIILKAKGRRRGPKTRMRLEAEKELMAMEVARRQREDQILVDQEQRRARDPQRRIARMQREVCAARVWGCCVPP